MMNKQTKVAKGTKFTKSQVRTIADLIESEGISQGIIYLLNNDSEGRVVAHMRSSNGFEYKHYIGKRGLLQEY